MENPTDISEPSFRFSFEIKKILMNSIFRLIIWISIEKERLIFPIETAEILIENRINWYFYIIKYGPSFPDREDVGMYKHVSCHTQRKRSHLTRYGRGIYGVVRGQNRLTNYNNNMYFDYHNYNKTDEIFLPFDRSLPSESHTRRAESGWMFSKKKKFTT